MKELSIEEKAARYDRSLERARDVHTYYCDDKEQLRKIEHIFPELAESEDKRIRKALIEGFKVMNAGSYGECTFSNYNIPVTAIIAWLEKQGEQNPISLEDAAKLFLEKLSESPYNNKPITDAQVITKELINFLKDTNTYNPNAINEQKPAEWRQDNVEELTEFENVMMHIGSSFFGENAGLNPNNTTCIKEQANLLLELVPKQEWSEEDMEILETCISLMSYNDAAKEETDWLKSLKERVLLQPKQEWSEDDTEMLDYIIRYIEVDKNNDTIRTKKTEVLEGMVAWLKSLKDRYTWKPSNEQMHYLYWIANIRLGDSVVEQEVSKHLNKLYEDLKKLRGK